MSVTAQGVRAVLFDLDGTLVDTAPDMVASLNTLLGQELRAQLSYERARCQVSHGSSGLLRLAFPEADPVAFELLRERFLTLYSARLTQQSALFAGCEQVLSTLEAQGIAWGIVTNKPGWLTTPLLMQLGLLERAGCVVSGDTLAERKPHPLPLQHAAQCLGVAPTDCVYVGDAQRDIVAARAAGMSVLLAGFGYLSPEDQPSKWAADGELGSPLALLEWLGIAAAAVA